MLSIYLSFHLALVFLCDGVANPDPTRGTVLRTVSPKLDLDVCLCSSLELSGSPPSSSHTTEENWTSHWTGSYTGGCSGEVRRSPEGGPDGGSPGADVIWKSAPRSPPHFAAPGFVLPRVSPAGSPLSVCQYPLLRVIRHTSGDAVSKLCASVCSLLQCVHLLSYGLSSLPCFLPFPSHVRD